MTWHLKLVEARRHNDFHTTKQFYDHLNTTKPLISYRRLSKIEAGTVSPRVNEINLLCEVLNISSDWLLLDEPATKAALIARINELDKEQIRQALAYIDGLLGKYSGDKP